MGWWSYYSFWLLSKNDDYLWTFLTANEMLTNFVVQVMRNISRTKELPTFHSIAVNSISISLLSWRIDSLRIPKRLKESLRIFKSFQENPKKIRRCSKQNPQESQRVSRKASCEPVGIRKNRRESPINPGTNHTKL